MLSNNEIIEEVRDDENNGENDVLSDYENEEMSDLAILINETVKRAKVYGKHYT